MKTILEIKDEKSQLLESNRKLILSITEEKRKFSDDEQSQYDKDLKKIEDLNKEIKKLENEKTVDDKKTKNIHIKGVKPMENFSLLRTIHNRVEGKKIDDIAQAVLEFGRNEFRASGINPEGSIILPVNYRTDAPQVTSTDAAGGYIVGKDQFSIIDPLRENLVSVQAGAQYLTNLVGDVSIPTYSGTTAAWKNEVSASNAGVGTFSEVTLAPKRLTAYLDISKQFLAQDSVGAEELLKRDIVNAVSAKLESTMFGKAAATTDQPAGLFNSVSDISGSATWANIVEFEKDVDTSNALMGNLKYVTNASGRAILKTTPKVSGSDSIMLMGMDNSVNGYPVLVTNHVVNTLGAGAEAGLVFGNFNDLIIGQWGGLDLLVDPYTRASYGQIRIVVNAYFDYAKRRTASFVLGSIA